MKRSKFWFVSLMAAILIGLFTLSKAHAQGMGIWEGKWFKVSYKASGYVIEYPESHSYSDQETVYLKIWSVDEINKVLHCDSYSLVDGEWAGSPLNLNFFGKNNLELLCWLYDSESNGRIEFTAMTFLIQGKMNKGSLASAKLKGLGGTSFIGEKNTPGSEYYRGVGFTITGSLIAESKVPVPPDKILHPYNIADYYPVSVGNQWNYTSGHNSITGTIKISNENVFISQNTLCDCGRDDYLTADERGMLFWGDSEEGIFSQPLVMFPPTWKVGEKKQLTVPQYSATLVLKLEGLEDVTTPAGQFESCLRFSVSVSFGNGSNYQEILHLAKGVGAVRTQRLKGSSPHSGCFLGIEDVCCPTCNWTQDLVSAVINGINIP